MLDSVTELFGREVIAGIAVYAGLAFLAAGPISERVAARDHLPACLKDQVRMTGETIPVATPEMMAAEIYSKALRQLPGPFGDIAIGALNAQKEAQERQRRQRAVELARRAPGVCQCRMSMALSLTRSDWALWVGTLKLYRPEAVSNFGGVMGRIDKDKVCERRT